MPLKSRLGVGYTANLCTVCTSVKSSEVQTRDNLYVPTVLGLSLSISNQRAPEKVVRYGCSKSSKLVPVECQFLFILWYLYACFRYITI